MWIKASGEITGNTIQITTATSSHLLVQGEYCAIIDAGVYPQGQDIWEHIEKEVETIEFILLTHAHFDHVGAVPYLRSKAPHLRLASGRHSDELLKDPEYTGLLYQKNSAACEAAGVKMDISAEEWHKALQVDTVLSDGESFSLGEGVEFVLIDTPGHTADSVSYYIKPDCIMAAGDLIGHYAGRDRITPSFSGEYKTYIHSLQRISSFDIQVLSMPHGGSLTGEMVTRYLTELLVYSDYYRDLFKKRLDSGEIISELAANICVEWSAEGRFPDGPFRESLEEAVFEMIRSSR